MNPAGERPTRSGTDRRTKRHLLMLAAIAVAPVLLSYVAYYAMPREARVNYGTLLATRPLAAIAGAGLDGKSFETAELRGRWVMLFAGSGACDAVCADALYASRQARTIQNAERERVQRVWLIFDDRAPRAGLISEHPDLVVARVSGAVAGALPEGTDRIYLIDPLGNLVLAWPSRPDIKAMAEDLTRLLRASGIG
jgi:hypothetical protein